MLFVLQIDVTQDILAQEDGAEDMVVVYLEMIVPMVYFILI